MAQQGAGELAFAKFFDVRLSGHGRRPVGRASFLASADFGGVTLFQILERLQIIFQTVEIAHFMVTTASKNRPT